MRYQPRHSAQAHRKRRRLPKLLRAALLLVVIALFIWPFAEPFMLETERVTIRCADLPEDIGQLTIVYLSDIHHGPFFGRSRVENLVSRVNALNPDLILLGGDYANSSAEAIAFFESMPGFHARYAVCGVVGNHDRTTPESNISRLKSVMRDAGVTPLVNEAVRIRIGSSDICIAGIDDMNNGHPQVASVAAQTKSDEFTIFMSHSPTAISEAFRAQSSDGRTAWIDLGLFGHTHGGQFTLLGNLLNPSGVPARYQQGWLLENRAELLVSRGVGTSILPLRFLCTPQIHLITVTR